MQFEPNEAYRFAAGFTVDDPVDSDLAGNVTLRTLNRTWYLGNRFNFGGGLNFYLNFEFWNTDYLGFGGGDAMRIKTVLIQKF